LERVKIKIQRALLLLALSVPLINTSAIPAHAHTALEFSVPSDNQLIDFMPNKLSASFEEDLIEIDGESVNTMELRSSNGTNYVLSSPTIAGPVISARVEDGEYPAADYLLNYRVVSADGHPIIGEISFSIQSSTTIGSAPGEPVTTAYVDESEESTSQTFIYILAGLLLALVISVVMKKRLGNGSRN
jgi:methionine-rich copper-binding protein CopC